MFLVGVLLALSFFALRWANHVWAGMDGPAELRVYKTAVIWCFLPGFAALAIPWPFTVWLLRVLGRTDEADRVTAKSNRRGGMDSFRVMKWLSFGMVGPIAALTVLAIPMHMSVSGSEILVGRYARLTPERFPISEATRATLVDGGRYRDGSFHPSRDLILDFAERELIRSKFRQQIAEHMQKARVIGAGGEQRLHDDIVPQWGFADAGLEDRTLVGSIRVGIAQCDR